MADRTSIEWTDATVNFWWGCTKVGPGCEHCYAETWSKRTGDNIWGVGVPRRKIKSALKTLYRLHNGYSWWAADAEIGKLHPNSRRRVFIQSMSDLFDKEVPQAWFDEAWDTITACAGLDIQIVTKRISLVEKRLNGKPWPKHVGLIISVVNQDEADRDNPRLITLKKAIGIPWVGLSMEPLLGRVTLRPEWLEHLNWVIVGGESGPGARPMHPDWARSLRDQCAAAGVPFFFKQIGEWSWIEPEVHHTDYAAACREEGPWKGDRLLDADGTLLPGTSMQVGSRQYVRKIGKKRAGRLLDGVEHNGMPA